LVEKCFSFSVKLVKWHFTIADPWKNPLLATHSKKSFRRPWL